MSDLDTTSSDQDTIGSNCFRSVVEMAAPKNLDVMLKVLLTWEQLSEMYSWQILSKLIAECLQNLVGDVAWKKLSALMRV